MNESYQMSIRNINLINHEEFPANEKAYKKVEVCNILNHIFL